MPTCPSCDNRFFNNREALQQHLRTSSAPHPLCVLCNRRFIDEIGYNSHMVAKHPPTHPCEPCSRTFTAQFALDDHYRGSSAHPNCGRCGKGFKDIIALDEHHATAHSPEAPKIPITANAVTSPKPTSPPMITSTFPNSPPNPAMDNEEPPAPFNPSPCPSGEVKPDSSITTPATNATALPDVDQPEESISKPPSPLAASTRKLPPSPPVQLTPELPLVKPAGTTLIPSLSPILEPLSPATPIPLLHLSSALSSLSNGNPPTCTTNQLPSDLHDAPTPPPARDPTLNNVLQVHSLVSETGSPGLVLNQEFSSLLQDVQPPHYSSPAPPTPLWNAGHKPGHSSNGSWISRDNIQSGPKVVPPLNLLARGRVVTSGLQRPFGTIAAQQGPLNANGGFQRWLNGVSRGSSGSPIDSSSPSVSQTSSRGKIFTLDPTPPNSSLFCSPGVVPLSRHPSQDSIVHDLGELYSTRPTNLRNSVIAGPLSPLQPTGSISQPCRSPTNSFKPGPSSLDLISFTTDKGAPYGSAGSGMGSRRSSASSINRWTWNHEEVDITSALSSASVGGSPHKSKFGMTLNNPSHPQLSPDEASPIDLAQLPELSPFPRTLLGGGSSLFDSPRLSSSQIKMATQLGSVGIGKWLGESASADGKFTDTVGGNISSSRVSPVPEEGDIVMESQLGREREKEKESIKEARERSQIQSSADTRKGKRNSLTLNSVSMEPPKAPKDDEVDEDVEDEKTKIQIDLGDLNADMATTLKKIDCEVFGKEFDEDISDIEGDIGSVDLVAEVHRLKVSVAPREEQNASASTSPQTAKPNSHADVDDAAKQEARHKQDVPVHKSMKSVLGSMNKLDSGSSTPLSVPLSPSSSIASYSKPTSKVLSPVTPPSDLEEETSQLSTSVLSKKAKGDEFDLSSSKEDDIHEEQGLLVPDKVLSRRPPLHCRICKIDRCQDAAATFCGHVFCYGCITHAIITKPSCPVCATPTLLYCVFRLDLVN